jgi:hypothetical protein
MRGGIHGSFAELFKAIEVLQIKPGLPDPAASPRGSRSWLRANLTCAAHQVGSFSCSELSKPYSGSPTVLKRLAAACSLTSSRGPCCTSSGTSNNYFPTIPRLGVPDGYRALANSSLQEHLYCPLSVLAQYHPDFKCLLRSAAVA